MTRRGYTGSGCWAWPRTAGPWNRAESGVKRRRLRPRMGAAHGVVGLTDAGVGVLGYSNWALVVVEGLSANSDGLHGYSNGYGDGVLGQIRLRRWCLRRIHQQLRCRSLLLLSRRSLCSLNVRLWGICDVLFQRWRIWLLGERQRGAGLRVSLEWVEGDCYANASGVSGASHYAGGIGVYASIGLLFGPHPVRDLVCGAQRRLWLVHSIRQCLRGRNALKSKWNLPQSIIRSTRQTSTSHTPSSNPPTRRTSTTAR